MNKSLSYNQSIIHCDKSLGSHNKPQFLLQGIQLLIISIVFFSITPSLLFAQEVVRPLSVNPELIKINKEKKTVNQLKSTLAIQNTLPFVDDFSNTTVYPDPKLWSDKKVYINSTFPVNPKTIGVATFDALDENGYLYKNATSKPFSADTLTSHPFDFKNKELKDLYFSFFYQAQGIGKRPWVGDYLFVEFYNPTVSKWYKVDSIPGDSLRPFKSAIFPVDTQYQKNGFMFRFRNLASLDTSEFAGVHGNNSQWHIDYIKLDTSRNEGDTILRDVAFVRPLTSLLKTYQSMPWEQYKNAFRSEMKSTIDISYRNNNNVKSPLIGRSFTFKEITTDNSGQVTNYNGGSYDIDPNTTVTLPANIESFDPNNPGDLVQFDIESTLSGTNDNRHQNDTLHYRQIFSNYFAYDDGTSEEGYGLWGQGTQDAMAAYQFNADPADSLVGVSFYFNPTEHDTTANFPFKLAVWKDNNGIPGDFIYTESNDALITPKKVSLNQFYNFKFDSAIIVSGKFYVGFVNKSESFLNIGFDLNNDRHNFLFINYNGTWLNSAVAGALMVRPVFKKIQEGPVTGNKTIKSQSFIVYPNPADNLIYIKTGNEVTSKPLSASVYSITGKLVLSTIIQEGSLDVSSLPSGFYILKVAGEKTNFSPVKILIQR